MPKTILLVTTGSRMKQYVLKHIKSLDYKLVVLEKAKNWATPWVDEWILADTKDPEACLLAVKKYQKQHTLNGVVTFDEFGVELTAFLTSALKFSGIDLPAAKTCRNKLTFRQFCVSKKLPYAHFRFLKNQTDIEYVQTKFKAPVIVKPTKAAGSQEVKAVIDLKELNINQHQNFLVEETLTGQEVDVDVLLQHGEIKFWSVSDNFNTAWPYFLQHQAFMPSALNLLAIQALGCLVQNLATQLNITDGCLHLEAMVEGTKITPIELNLRMGASATFKLNEVAYGVDFIESILKIHTQQPLLNILNKPIKKYLETYYFRASKAGILSTLNFDLKMINTLPNVEDFQFYAQMEQVVELPPQGFKALGHLVVSGSSPAQAHQNLKKFYRA